MPVSRFLNSRIAGYLVLPVVIAMVAPPVAAQEGPARGCLLAPAQLPDALVKAFKDRPADLLERYPTGGLVMSSEVKRLVATDVASLEALIGLAKGAKPAHVVAIGAGLAQAAGICARFRPDTQRQIEEAVSTSGLSDLSAAFAVYKLAASTSPAIPLAEVTPTPPVIGDPTVAVSVTTVTGSPPAGSEPSVSTEQPPSAAPTGQVPPVNDGMGPFATSESALPFFAGQGGVGGGVPPDGTSPSLQLGDFTFSPVALPFFAAGINETSRDVVSPAR